MISVGFKLIVYARFGAVRVWLIMVAFCCAFYCDTDVRITFLYCDFVVIFCVDVFFYFCWLILVDFGRF